MISELTIESYRGIRNMKLDNLGKINIIAGANNTGKTSILEVMQSLVAPDDLRNWRMISRREFLRMPPTATVYETLSSLFSVDTDICEDRIKFSGINDGKTFDVEIKADFYKTFINER